MTNNGGCFRLRVVRNNLGENRFVFVISGKEIRKAVSRNKIRRRAREILRKLSANIKKGNDLTFIFNKLAEERGYNATEQEITRVLEERRLIK